MSEYSKREIIQPWIVMIIIMFVILSPLYFSPYNKIPSNANLVANYQLNSNFKYFSYEVKKTDRYLLDYHFYNSSNQNLYFNFSILIDNKIAISYNSSDYSQKLITKIRNWSDQDEYFLQKGQIITIEGTTVGKDEIRLYNNIRYDLANYGFNVPIIIFLVYLIPIYLFFTDKIYRYRDIGDIPQIFKDCLNNEKVYPDISSSLKLFLFNLFSLLVLVVQILLSLQYKNSISDFYRLSIFDFGGYAFGIYIASILINLFSVLLMMYYNYLTKRKRMILFLFWFIIYSLAFTFLVPGIIDFFRNSSFGWAW